MKTSDSDKHELEHSKRLYEAAKTSDTRVAAEATRPPDYVTQFAGQRLLNYTRWLDENHDLTTGALDSRVDEIVGQGVTIEPQALARTGDAATEFNELLSDFWEEVQGDLDFFRQLPFCELQRLICRSWLRDGEVFLEHVDGPVRANRDRIVPYSIRMYEAEWCPLLLNSREPTVTQGIEKDDDGIPTYAHFSIELPTTPYFVIPFVSTEYRRVPFTRLEHLKFSRRLNQTRGVSILHAVIRRLEDLKDIECYEREASRIAAAFTYAIIKNPDLIDSVTDDELTAAGKRVLDMEGGIGFDSLLPGEDIKSIGLNRPNNQLIDFIADNVRRFAAGIGGSYSTISKRYDGTYSSRRQERVEQNHSNQSYIKLFAEKIVRPVRNRAVQWGIDSGYIRVPRSVDRKTILRADYRGPALQSLDLQKDAAWIKTMLETKVKSRKSIQRSLGEIPGRVDEEIMADELVNTDVEDPPEVEDVEQTDAAEQAEVVNL